jgi:hypothetical protein
LPGFAVFSSPPNYQAPTYARLAFLFHSFSDPQVGNGVQFTKMLPEDGEKLAQFLVSEQPEL